MAQNWWEDDPVAEGNNSNWWSSDPLADAPAADPARQELPAGVVPSAAGGGRGIVNPTAVQSDNSRSIGQIVGDTALAGLQGAMDFAQLPGTVGGLITGNMDNAYSRFFQRGIDAAQDLKSDQIKAENQKLQSAIDTETTLLGKFKEGVVGTITNPALAADQAARMFPGVLAGGGVGRAVETGAKTATGVAAVNALSRNSPALAEAAVAASRVAQVAPVAGAVGVAALQQGQGVGAEALQQAKQIPLEMWQANDQGFRDLVVGGMDPEAARVQRANEMARTATGQAALVSLVTQALPGGRSIETAVVRKAQGNRLAGAAATGAKEAVSEGLEEGGGSAAKDLQLRSADASIDVLGNAAGAAGMGAGLGGPMGAAAGAATTSPRAVNFTPPDSVTAQAGLAPVVVPLPQGGIVQGEMNAGATGPVQRATADGLGQRGDLGATGVEPAGLGGVDPIGDVRPGAERVDAVDGAAGAVADARVQPAAPVAGDPLRRAADTDLLSRAQAAQPAPTEQPTTIWTGRAGDGYVTRQDAEVALPTRVKREPDLRWEIEQMPSGKFRLAGYEQQPAAQAQPETQPQAQEITAQQFMQNPAQAIETAQQITFAPGQLGAVKIADRKALNSTFNVQEMDDGTTVFTRTGSTPAGEAAQAGGMGQRGAPTAPTASQQSIVMSSLNRGGKQQFIAVGANTEHSGIAQRIAAAFGRPIMFVKERSNNAGFSALFYRDMGVIVANAEGRRPMYAAVTHEVYHGLPEDLRARTTAAVMATVTPEQRARFLDQFPLYQKADGKMQDEELVARIIEQDAENPQFWQKLADRMGDSEFAKLAREILGMLDRLLSGFTREDSSEFTSDIKRVREVVADAYAEAQARLGSDQVPATQQDQAQPQTAPPVKQTESIVDGVKYSADRRNLMDAPTIDIQSLVGKRVFGIKADLLDAGRSYTGIDGSQLEFPIEMLGGPGFPRLPENMASGVVWAVRGGAVLSKIQKKVESTDYVLVHAMNDNSHLTNTTASTAYIKTVEAYLRDGRISKANLLALDQIVRDPKNQLSLPSFPGFEAPNIIEYIDGLSFDQRGALAKMLEKKEAQQHGLPNLERFRRETIDPEFVGYRQGDAMLVLEVDKTNPVVKLGEDGTKMHPSYPLGIKGRIVGKLAKGVNYDVIYRDYFRDTVPSFKNGMDGAWYGFDRVIPEQEITQDIANSVSPGGYKAIRNARQAEASLAFANGNWLESGRTKAQGGVSVQEFVDALRANDGAAALTMYDQSEVKAGIKDGSFRVFQLGTQGGDKGLQVFFGLKRGAPWYKDMIDGVGDNEVEVVSVTNNEKGAPGVGVPAIITKAIQEGATVLDAFAVKSERFPDGFLPEMYGQFGFEEIGRIPFDPSYYDDIPMSDLKAFWRSGGWKDSDGYPDVVVMRWKGKDEDRAGTVDRYVRTGETGVSTRAARHLRSAAGDAGGQRNRPGAPQGRTRGADGAQARGDQGAGNAAPVVRRAYGSIQEIASLSDGDIRNLGLDPAEVSRLRAKLESPDSTAASPTSVVLYSADRDRSPADRIRWRKLTDVKSDVSLDRIPAHITPFANFMRDMAVKANAGGLTSRDLIKAYTIARSSMNRGAVNTAKAVAAGLQLPTNFTDAKIRPEGAFGYWLLSPVGQSYLNAAEIGVTDQAAIADAVKTMAPFGTQNTLGGDLERAASGMLHSRLPAMTKAIVRAAEGKNAVKDWQEATADIYGVREAKKGFLGSLLGFGQLPTFDARQINLNVAADSKEDTLKALSSTRARDVVAKLARRMDALQLAVDPEFSPFYRHLAHHAVWDAVGGTQTTHSDVIDAMVMASADRTAGRLDGIEAYHYSKASRQSLSSSSFGTGLQGSARDEYLNATDPRRRQRISFYVNKGTGVRPEAGVGSFAHRATLDNIYDANSDPQNLRKGGQAAFESSVLDAGFDGYLDRLEGDQPGQVILLGQRTVNVTPIGPRTRIDDAKPVPAAAARKATREEGGVVVRRPDGQQMMGVIRAMPALRTAAPSFKLQYGEARVDRAEAEAANAALREAGTDFQFEVAAPMASADRAVTETPAFKRWFGDSKVVDADGKPLVVYHGAGFDLTEILSQAEVLERSGKSGEFYNRGIYFSPDASLAGHYARAKGMSGDAPVVYPVYLSLQNPKVIPKQDLSGSPSSFWEKVKDKLSLQGEDARREARRKASLERRQESMYVTAEAIAEYRRQGYDGIINEDASEIVVFDPTQIKSAIGNNGQFDPQNPDIRMSADRGPLGLYSALSRAVEAMPTKASSAGGWKTQIQGLINKGAVKADEVEWSGVNDWLDMQPGKVTKEEFTEFLRGNGVQVEEVTLGDVETGPQLDAWLEKWSEENEGETANAIYNGQAWSYIQRIAKQEGRQDVVDRIEAKVSGAEPKYRKYTLPGGENYREVLLTLPDGGAETVQDQKQRLKEKYGVDSWFDLTDAQKEDLRISDEKANRPREKYKSSHWDQPNVIAHIRVNDRTDADGKRVLFVEEIQSDWGQEGKKKGFAKPMLTAAERDALQIELNKMVLRRTRMIAADREAGREQVSPETEALQKEIAQAQVRLSEDAKSKAGVPMAPFVGKTDGWLNLALKRVIAMAVDGGYDAVAFVNGDQSADRYDLSKQVDSITYEPTAKGYNINVLAGGSNIKQGNYTVSELEDIVGKEIVQKMEAREGRQEFDPAVEPDLADTRVLEGVDLKVGGEGMKAFYDKIVPNAVKALLKKIGGGQLELVKVQQTQGFEGSARKAPAKAISSEQPGFAITDTMREKVSTEGLPLFSANRAGPIQGSRFTLPSMDGNRIRWDKIRRALQDDALRMKRVQDAVLKQGGTVNEEQNFYDANTLMPGRVQTMMDDFRKGVILPMIEKAAKAKIDLEELALYAYAKHAEERNDYIASINPRMPDGGSGMTTADANKILADIAASGKQAQYDDLHQDLMSITETTRRVLLDEGLITQDQFDAMEQQYGNYIPLRGFENVDEETGSIRHGIGRGINVRGKETIKALGRASRAGDLIENVIRDYQRAVVRSEKNNVGKVFLDFVISNMDPDLWDVNVEKTSASYNKALGVVQYTKSIDKGEDTIGVKVAGQQVYITIKADKDLTRALKQSFKDEVSGLERATLAMSGWYNNLMRNVLTRYNPPFAMVNAIRDAQSGLVAAVDELGAKGAARFSAHLPKAIAATTADEGGWQWMSNPLTQQYLREFKAAGAVTGGFFMRNLEDIAQDLRDDLLMAGAAPRTLGEKAKYNKATKLAYKGARGFLRGLELMGAASENATRFALYMAARDMGRTPAQAALLAKNGTTNFNRKGEWGGALNNLYLFFNAAVQGNAQLFKTLKNPKVAAALTGVAGLAVTLGFLNAGMGGEDDDGEKYWDKVPNYEKERNLIIMLKPGDTLGEGISRVGKRGRYIKIPVQYGLNFFPNLGYSISDIIRNKQDPRQGKTVAKASMHMASTFFGSLNPFGGALDLTDGVSIAMAVAPTIVDLPIQIGTERNAFGTPTAPTPFPGDTRPDSERMFISQMDGFAADLAKAMNRLGGGNEAKAGEILGLETAVTPGTIKTIIAGTTGGLGGFFEQIYDTTAGMLWDDKNLKPNHIPMLNKVYGEAGEDVNVRLAGDRMREVKKAVEVIEKQIDAGIKPDVTKEDKRLMSIANAQEIYNKESVRLRKDEINVIRSTTMTPEQKRIARDNIMAARDRMATSANRVYLNSFGLNQKGDAK